MLGFGRTSTGMVARSMPVISILPINHIPILCNILGLLYTGCKGIASRKAYFDFANDLDIVRSEIVDCKAFKGLA